MDNYKKEILEDSYAGFNEVTKWQRHQRNCM